MTDARELSRFSWPAAQLGDGVLALARESGLAPRSVADLPALPKVESWQSDVDYTGEAVHALASHLDLQASPASLKFSDAEAFLATARAAVIQRPGAAGILMVVRGDATHVELLAPDLRLHSVAIDVVLEWWHETELRWAEEESAPLLAQLSLTGERARRARACIVSERMRDQRVRGVWVLGLTSTRPMAQWVRQYGLPGDITRFGGAYAAAYGLTIVSWWLLGKSALSGRQDVGWLWAWGLVVATAIPFGLVSSWYESRFNIGLATMLRERLLAGIGKLSPDEARHDGVGHHLGRVLEISALETLTLTGGTLAVLGSFELIVAGTLMTQWGAGWPQVVLLCAWTLAGLLIWRSYSKEREQWTERRLALSHDVIEKMMGHRTRAVQQSAERQNDGEDSLLAQYLGHSASMDGKAALLSSWPRGWLVLGSVPVLVGIVVAGWSATRIALSLGVMLLAERALAKLAHGAGALTGAQIAWRSLRPLLSAAMRPDSVGSPEIVMSLAVDGRGEARAPKPSARSLVEVAGLSYAYPGRIEPVVERLEGTIASGDRVLVDAPSGAGKSTFVSLLTGIRAPRSGVIRFRGFDRESVGERAWSRHVASAPQFHENHLFADTLAFNLLLGRRWPPTADDLQTAERLCRELGLGPLFDRMPAGMSQIVGETGWQLSHGERSRVFLARALLQNAEVVVLDESFAALDPESLGRAVRCASDSAEALVVVAHP